MRKPLNLAAHIAPAAVTPSASQLSASKREVKKGSGKDRLFSMRADESFYADLMVCMGYALTHEGRKASSAEIIRELIATRAAKIRKKELV